MTLREIIKEADKGKVAIGHFNISNLETLWGIFSAAKNLNVPVIIGTSEGERKFVGVKQAVALVRSLREEHDYPIFLNADHTYSFEGVKEAVDAGYDAVIFDGTKLPLEENIKITKQCVEYAKSVNPDILVEGEIGYIGSSSKLLDDVPEGASVTEGTLTKPEELKQYVKDTGVDLVAPAVGNLHGMLKSGKNPALDIKRVEELREAGGVPVVLHGGSGITDEDFVKAIKAGISIVHINTEIRVTYRKALQIALQENPDEIASYKYMKGVVRAVEDVIEKRLRLFNS
ncbi:tagatose-bisphosphate aldolase [bacterium]|nr:tagatose-bisphosphate aldolase [bacterium]|tara:strand:- start:10444 stop:11304 length:861 start_codon:yes stop_codon:yes gene_type:complete